MCPRSVHFTLLVTIRNLTYGIHNEDYSVFDKVNEYLESVLYLFTNATKKESGITVTPKKDANRFETKRRIVDIPKKEHSKFRKELDSRTARKQKLLNLLLAKR